MAVVLRKMTSSLRKRKWDRINNGDCDDDSNQGKWKITEQGEDFTSLLDMTRSGDFVADPTTEQEQEEKARLVLKHQHEFPSKIREKIRAAADLRATSTTIRAADFLVTIRHAIQNYFLPCLSGRDVYMGTDTEDQIEVAVRCFPEILRTTVCGVFPLFTLMVDPRTWAYVPLFARASVDAGAYVSERGGLAPNCDFFYSTTSFTGYREPLYCLVTGHRIRFIYPEPIMDRGDDFDKHSTAVLSELRERGLLFEEDAKKLLTVLLTEVNKEEFCFRRKLKFLIDWKPDLLMGSGQPLLLTYANDSDAQENVFREILRLGLSHYPERLGFLAFGLFRLVRSLGNERALAIHQELTMLLNEDDHTGTSTTATQPLFLAMLGNMNPSVFYERFRRNPVNQLNEWQRGRSGNCFLSFVKGA